MQNAFFILPIVYIATVLAVIGIAIAALWRIMKAQETTARALQDIAQALARGSGPSV